MACKTTTNKCNEPLCLPEDVMATANAGCSVLISPEGFSAEKLIYDQSFKDLINQFGYNIDYYVHTFNMSVADKLYGEDPPAVYYGPISIRMYMELENEAISLQQFGGFEAADDFTGFVHIQTFIDTLSGKDFFVQTECGDILQYDCYLNNLQTELDEEGIVSEVLLNPIVTEKISASNFSLPVSALDVYSNYESECDGCDPREYTIIDKYIENNHLLEPKSGDLIDFVQLGCDRPNGRCSKIFEVTERMDQDLAGGLNPLLGHYIWRLRAKRYEPSFEPGAPQECLNDQVYENEQNGVTRTNIPGDEPSDPKSYDWNIDTASKEVFDMDDNDTDIYGSYY